MTSNFLWHFKRLKTLLNMHKRKKQRYCLQEDWRVFRRRAIRHNVSIKLKILQRQNYFSFV